MRILNPGDYLAVMTTGVPVQEKKHYLAEYNKYVDETIVYDQEYHIVFSIMRDITARRSRRPPVPQLHNQDGGDHQPGDRKADAGGAGDRLPAGRDHCRNQDRPDPAEGHPAKLRKAVAPMNDLWTDIGYVSLNK